MTEDLAVIVHHKARMSSGRKACPVTFPFGNAGRWRHPCGSPGVGRRAGNHPQPAPFFGPTHLPRSICSIPGRRGMETKSGQRAKNARYIRRLAWATLRPGARRPRRYWCGRQAPARQACSSARKSSSCRPSIQINFCLAGPAACAPGCRSCEFHDPRERAGTSTWTSPIFLAKMACEHLSHREIGGGDASLAPIVGKWIDGFWPLFAFAL